MPPKLASGRRETRTVVNVPVQRTNPRRTQRPPRSAWKTKGHDRADVDSLRTCAMTCQRARGPSRLRKAGKPRRPPSLRIDGSCFNDFRPHDAPTRTPALMPRQLGRPRGWRFFEKFRGVYAERGPRPVTPHVATSSGAPPVPSEKHELPRFVEGTDGKWAGRPPAASGGHALKHGCKRLSDRRSHRLTVSRVGGWLIKPHFFTQRGTDDGSSRHDVDQDLRSTIRLVTTQFFSTRGPFGPPHRPKRHPPRFLANAQALARGRHAAHGCFTFF